MKTLTIFGLVSLSVLAPLANAQDDCVVTSADPATVMVTDLTAAGLGYYYNEERNGLDAGGVPVPQSGFLVGDGSWTYQESNQLPLLQRGGTGLTGEFFPPGCDAAWDPTTSAPGSYPCAIGDLDPINDETCGAGPDALIW